MADFIVNSSAAGVEMGAKTTIVVFGGTGDLMRRKLMPAFLSMHARGKLSGACIIGVGRREFTHDSYRNFLAESNEVLKGKIDGESLQVFYYKNDFEKSSDILGLHEIIKFLGREESKIIFYLATSYEFFPRITEMIASAGLNAGGARIVFEKPFGRDYKSCLELDNSIKKHFFEEQVFRIDHYLAKETVQNLQVLKFANPLIEKMLNRDFVERIEIIADEKIGVEGRIGYYESSGAINDMIQSHLLQVLALVLMDYNKDVHDAKLKALKNLKVKSGILGQYKSYSTEAEKSGFANTKTETFARMVLASGDERWKGSEIVLRTGKKLPEKYGQIRVLFKSDVGLLGSLGGSGRNKLVIDIFPKQDINLFINMKNPGNGKIEEVKVGFSRECYFGPNTADEYAVLFDDILKGEKTLFTRFDELLESWRIADEMQSAKRGMEFLVYEDGSEPENMRS